MMVTDVLSGVAIGGECSGGNYVLEADVRGR